MCAWIHIQYRYSEICVGMDDSVFHYRIVIVITNEQCFKHTYDYITYFYVMLCLYSTIIICQIYVHTLHTYFCTMYICLAYNCICEKIWCHAIVMHVSDNHEMIKLTLLIVIRFELVYINTSKNVAYHSNTKIVMECLSILWNGVKVVWTLVIYM